jgi:hypothetical protein
MEDDPMNSSDAVPASITEDWKDAMEKVVPCCVVLK